MKCIPGMSFRSLLAGDLKFLKLPRLQSVRSRIFIYFPVLSYLHYKQFFAEYLSRLIGNKQLENAELMNMPTFSCVCFSNAFGN